MFLRLLLHSLFWTCRWCKLQASCLLHLRWRTSILTASRMCGCDVTWSSRKNHHEAHVCKFDWQKWIHEADQLTTNRFWPVADRTVHLYFISYLSGRKDTTPFMYCTFQVLTVVSVSRSIFVLYICKMILIAIIVFTGFVFTSVYCTFTLFYMYYFSVLVVHYAVFPWVICGGGRLRVVHTHHKAIMISIVAFWGTRLVECGCDGCLMLSPPQISVMYEETLAFTQCALKWKGTSLLLTRAFAWIIYGIFFIGSCWTILFISFEMFEFIFWLSFQ